MNKVMMDLMGYTVFKISSGDNEEICLVTIRNEELDRPETTKFLFDSAV